jgi:hypothetical protein
LRIRGRMLAEWVHDNHEVRLFEFDVGSPR